MITLKPKPAIRLAVAILFLFSLSAWIGCGREQAKTEQQAAKSTAGLFTVPADQLSHVELYNVQPVELQRMLRLTGTVNYNAFKTTPVISAVGGPVARIAVVPGNHVQRGQPMLYVSSPDYSQLRATYLKAQSAFNVADKNFSRAQDLYQHHAIAEKDLLDAEAARTQAQADLQTSEQSLRILGVKDPQAALKTTVAPELPVLAPITGEVVDQTVAPGQLIQAGQTQCFTISDMSTVWVIVNVYQNDLADVRIGDPVTIQTDAYPQKFSGKISYIAAALDPTSRTLQARIVTENPGEKLKKDMYVSATVLAGTIKNALAVPDSAVLRNAQNEPFVYVSAGQNQFAQRQIAIGQSIGGRTQVTSGLKPGDQVVAQGAVFLQFANTLQQY
ncbi:MAG: efflux RND transporter periplasmic adaptor subunit [Acidobacteria bacterium]|nr:efflux RND transporter periplasmic adaptor subunit [Acidobacteriota bacterium]MBV9145455.1 efflux RND transporter periplasmic adaptor subunit [Acidobacteriota bacterium]